MITSRLRIHQQNNSTGKRVQLQEGSKRNAEERINYVEKEGIRTGEGGVHIMNIVEEEESTSNMEVDMTKKAEEMGIEKMGIEEMNRSVEVD